MSMEEGRPTEGANDYFAALLQFSNGARGTVDVSSVARTADAYGEQHVCLHGEDGSLVADFRLAAGASVHHAKGGAQLQLLTIPGGYLRGVDAPLPFVDSFVSMFTQQPIGCRLFVDSILEGRTVAPSFHDGWKAQQAIDAALESHQSGRWTAVGEA